MKEKTYLILDKESGTYMEYEEDQILTRNDVTFLEYYLEGEYQRGYDTGFSEGEKTEKDKDDPSKE